MFGAIIGDNNINGQPQDSKLLQLNKHYTFDKFVVGAGNKFAHSAALTVVNAPGEKTSNPLFIYGGAGLGKTHLLQSIGNHIINSNSKCVVTYISTEEFYTNFIESVKNSCIQDFTRVFRYSDVLLVDDIQFFADKERTQDEFFHIFNALNQNGKQIVLTSDLPPLSLKGFQEKLISRFLGGVSVDIQPPDFETRVTILEKKAEEVNINLPQEILYYIAENITSNIRELEGAVWRLFAFASAHKSDITIELAKDVLKDNIKI